MFVVSGLGSVHSDVRAGGTSPGDISYFMQVDPPLAACVGEQFAIHVKVVENRIPSAGPRTGETTGVLSRLGDVSVKSTSVPSDVLDPASQPQTTNVSTGGAEFVFTAVKAGESAVTFTADLSRLVVPDGSATPTIETVTRAVHVRTCAFKLHTTSNWQFSDSRLAVTANISDALLELDTSGHVNTTVPVTWGSGFIVGPGCVVTETIDKSTAVVTGSLDDSGKLSLQIAYGATTVHNHVQCPKDDHTATLSLTPGTVNPIGSEYLPHIDRLPQSLAGLGKSKSGDMLYVVVPERVK